jgi:hypothetical protein
MIIKRIPTGGFDRITEAVTTEFGQLMELVRQALREKQRVTPGQEGYYCDIRGIFPDRVVASMQGRLYSYPYTVGDDNKVTVGEATEVVVQFQTVAGAAAASAIAEAVQAGDHVALREAADGSIEVTLIRAGASINGNYYSDSALRDGVKLFEGVRVFSKTDDEHTKGTGKAVSNLIGGVYGARFVEGKGADSGAIVGTFKPLNPSDPVVTKMTEAVKRGMAGLMGLSIDAIAKTEKRKQGAKVLKEATKFFKVNSVDLIVEPGAGGGLDRLTEAVADESLSVTGATMPLWKQNLLKSIETKDPAKFATIDAAKIADDDLYRIAESVGAIATPVDPAAQANSQATQQRVTEANTGNTDDNAPVTRAEVQMISLRHLASERIGASKLPAVAKEKLKTDFQGRQRFTEAEVDNAIKAEGDYLARFSESGNVRVPSFAGANRIEVGDRSKTIDDMLAAFFDPAHKDHRNVRSFRECYVEITGDYRVTGDMKNVDRARMEESLGRFSEAVDSTTFSNALGSSITRRMQTVFTGLVDLQAWRRVATVTPVNDFRTQERTRIGGYGNLPAVAQSGAYTALTSPSDAKATYAVTKRGGTESVTLEAIKNDDVRAIRRIPEEMALAAANTLYEFVFDFFRTNPTIYDTVALYHATHGNLFTAALDATSFAAHRLAMLKQSRAGSAKRMAVSPAAVLVPYELQEVAFNLFVRGQNLDKTFVQTINPEVIPVSYWTDANDWVTVADPMRLPALEIGFLDGREEPETFVQDMPNVGSLFSNDQVTYKIRHIYGGNVLVDGEKATTKAVVP